jgi:hypothetical protein
MNVKAHGRKVMIILDQKTLETTLKQMAAPLMPSVKPDRITDTKPLNGTGKGRLFRMDQQMKVVLHQNIGMNLNLESFHHPACRVKKSEIVFLIPKDIPSLISTGKHMIKRIRIVHPKGSRHGPIIHLYGILSTK